MYRCLSCLITILITVASCTSETGRPAGEHQPDSSVAESGDETAAPEVDSAATSEEITAGSDSARWSEEPIRMQRTVSEVAVVGALRSGSHSDYDRFVVEFQNGIVPSYHVAYLEGDARECGSGGLIDLDGRSVLEVRLEPARGYDERGTSTVDHAQRDIDMTVLQEAEISCDFEAVFAVVLGVARRGRVRVMELEDPARLIVDIRHTME